MPITAEWVFVWGALYVVGLGAGLLVGWLVTR